MNAHVEREVDFLQKYLGQLVGATIESVDVKVEEDMGYPEVWPRLQAKLADGTTVTLEVSQDTEGNGPGFLFGLPMPS